MRVYIINERATRKKLDDISHRGYFMGYVAPTGVILYWRPYQPSFIHRDHHVWFDEYNSCLSIEDKQNPDSLLLHKYPESLINNINLLNFIPCELNITSTTFSDTAITTYEI